MQKRELASANVDARHQCVIVNTREINSFRERACREKACREKACREKACREKAWTENAPGSQRNKKAARTARLFAEREDQVSATRPW
jgi:hypothetical protein